MCACACARACVCVCLEYRIETTATSCPVFDVNGGNHSALLFCCVVRPLHTSAGHKMDARGATACCCVVAVVAVVVVTSRDLCACIAAKQALEIWMHNKFDNV